MSSPFLLQPFPSQYLRMYGPPGDPIDIGSGRYPPADLFNAPFDGASNLDRYCSVTTLQAHFLFNRIAGWGMEGTCRLNANEVPGSTPEFDEEYQILDYFWSGETERSDEADLVRDYAVREGFYSGGTVPWRGFSSHPTGVFDPDTEKVPLAIGVDGDTGPDGPGPYSDPSNGDGDLRLLEWAYTVNNSWDVGVGADGGHVSCDFLVRSALWKSAVGPGGMTESYTTAKPYDMKCFGETADAIVIVGKIGSIDGARATPVIGTVDSYDYNFIFYPTLFWGWDGRFDTLTGLPI